MSGRHPRGDHEEWIIHERISDESSRSIWSWHENQNEFDTIGEQRRIAANGAKRPVSLVATRSTLALDGRYLATR